MSFLKIKNVSIRGVSACVPRKVEENINLPLFSSKTEVENVIESTGIERRLICANAQTLSDLCVPAVERLLKELAWEKSSVAALVFISQTPDYVQPPTSCILQDRLGFDTGCYTLDISSGCTGWVSGMSVLSGLLSGQTMKRGLLLCGDVSTRIKSPKDKASWPLFGDAGTATALEFDKNAADMDYLFGTDGSGYDAIIMKHGGMRRPFTAESFEYQEIEPGRWASNAHTQMKGMDVFLFGITTAPKITEELLKYIGKTKEDIDYFLFHQANKFLNERVRNKLGIISEKTPYSLKDFGNTSSASIPLTLVSQLRSEYSSKKLTSMAISFGIGLSWGAMSFVSQGIACPELLEI